MKSSVKGLILCCLLGGIFSSVYCQEPPNGKTSVKVNEQNTTVPKSDADNVPTSTEIIKTDPITTTSATVVTTPSTPDTNPNDTTTVKPTPDQNTTATVAPITTPTPAPNTTTTPPPETTTPATNSTTTTTTTTTTTAAPDNSTTTTTTTTTPAPPTPRPPCNHFDFPSFIGGIVLTLGTLAISLVAYKFYKARNERNYHTL